MLVIKVELHSAITGQISEIARMRIYNDMTGSREIGNYVADVFDDETKTKITATGAVKKYPRLTAPVWSLVAKSLKAAGFK